MSPTEIESKARTVNDTWHENDRDATIEHIEQRLLKCRRRLHRLEVAGLIRKYLPAAALVVAVISALFLAVKLLLVFGGSTERLMFWTDYAYIASLIFALAALAVRRIILPAAHLPSTNSATERLDRTAGDHNRMATALWLLEEDFKPDSPLAMAAIRDGVEHLERHWDSRPGPAAARHSPGRYRPRFAAACLLFLACLAMIVKPPTFPQTPPGTGPGSAHPFPAAIAAVAPPSDNSQNDKTATPRQADAKSARDNNPDSHPSKAVDAPRDTSRRPAKQKSTPSGRGKNASASQSQSGGGSNGQSADGGASNPSQRKKKKTPDAAKQHKRKTATARSSSNQDPKQNRSSSAAGGGSSGGAMRAVQNSWSQQDRAANAEDTEDDDEGEADEQEQQSSKQRGGIQPALKDRNQAPSRELGIGEGSGPPGSGRGGPTPPKKSRGTASMVMGLPMPDFVKGRLGPGTTKITHERVTPSPQPGRAAQAVPLEKRTLPENPISRFRARGGENELVRRYLLSIHSADQAKTESTNDNE